MVDTIISIVMVLFIIIITALVPQTSAVIIAIIAIRRAVAIEVLQEVIFMLAHSGTKY